MKMFIEYVVKELVDNTLDVEVTETEIENTLQYELKVGDGDLGKVIGRGGKTVRALRTLVSAIASKQGKRATLEILE